MQYIISKLNYYRYNPVFGLGCEALIQFYLTTFIAKFL